MTMKGNIGIVACVLMVLFCGCAGNRDKSGEARWISLFNGKDLDGWTPKIRGARAGRELRQHLPRRGRRDQGGPTNAYERFDDRFGHLFYKEPFFTLPASASSTALWANRRPAGRAGPGATAAS